MIPPLVTIVGWNFPSGTTFGNGLIALILPLVTMGAFSGIPLLLEQRGNVIVTMALIGYEIGSVAGMLSLSAASPTSIPFANVVIGGIFIAVWLWKGE